MGTSAESDPVTVPSNGSNRKQPYLGMTGTQLNIWVTVACTTAMTLFGGLILLAHLDVVDLMPVFVGAGYDQGVFGGIIVTPDFLETMGNPDPNLQGTIVSLYDIGWYVWQSLEFRQSPRT